ncbi:MAG: O-antigen ligase family protein [Deltaproteobacteria bacterium]|nr:O-antigen ligase family protein [Deltaproteobacteria bacterium]
MAAPSTIITLEPQAVVDDPNAIWQKCLDRARVLVLTPILSLTLLFLLVFGVGYAVLAENTDGWVIVALVGGVLLFVICFDNLKLWMIFYSLVFIAPKMKFGDWAGGGGEKLFGIQGYEPLIGILLLLWIPRLVARRRLELPRLLKAVLVALGLIGLNAIRIAPDRMQAIREAGRLFFEPLVLFVVITSVPWRRSELKAAALVFVFASALVAAIGIVGYGMGHGGGGGEPAAAGKAVKTAQSLRLESYWEATNSLAAFLVAALAVSVGMAFSARSIKGILLAAGAIPIQLLSIVLTFTRGAWMACAVALLALSLQLRRIGWVVLGLVLATGVIAVAPPEMLERVASIASFQTERSSANRIHMWHYAVPALFDRPLTGYGFYGFHVLFSSQPGITSAHAHNFMLDYALAIGIPGLLLVLILISFVLVDALRTVSRRRRESGDVSLLAGLAVGCMGMLCAGMVDGSISVWPILAHSFWFLLALTYCLKRSIDGEFTYVVSAGQHSTVAAGQ